MEQAIKGVGYDEGDHGFVAPNTLNFFERESSVYDRVGIWPNSFIMQEECTYDCPCHDTRDVIHIHYKWNSMYPYIYVRGEDRFWVESLESPPRQLERGEQMTFYQFDPEYRVYRNQRKTKPLGSIGKRLPLILIEPERCTFKDPEKQRMLDAWVLALHNVIEAKKKESPGASEGELLDKYVPVASKLMLVEEPSLFDTTTPSSRA